MIGPVQVWPRGSGPNAGFAGEILNKLERDCLNELKRDW
jgi:hypothetical protein